MLDISPELFENVSKPNDSLIRAAWEYIKDSVRFLPENLDGVVLPAGQRVRHSVFGSGTVLEADTDKGAHIIQFDDLPTPRALSFKAKLEKL